MVMGKTDGMVFFFSFSFFIMFQAHSTTPTFLDCGPFNLLVCCILYLAKRLILSSYVWVWTDISSISLHRGPIYCYCRGVAPFLIFSFLSFLFLYNCISCIYICISNKTSLFVPGMAFVYFYRGQYYLSSYATAYSYVFSSLLCIHITAPSRRLTVF